MKCRSEDSEPIWGLRLIFLEYKKLSINQALTLNRDAFNRVIYCLPKKNSKSFKRLVDPNPFILLENSDLYV